MYEATYTRNCNGRSAPKAKNQLGKIYPHHPATNIKKRYVNLFIFKECKYETIPCHPNMDECGDLYSPFDYGFCCVVRVCYIKNNHHVVIVGAPPRLTTGHRARVVVGCVVVTC